MQGSEDAPDRIAPERIAPDRIVEEHDYEDQELAYHNPEDNEAHAPGQVCARCGKVITAGQDARLGANGWVHEVCP